MAAGRELGTSATGGITLLRFRAVGALALGLLPSMGFEPLINVCAPQTEPTTLMKLRPAAFAIPWLFELAVVMEVTMVDRGMLTTGRA